MDNKNNVMMKNICEIIQSLSSRATHLALAMHSRVASLAPATTDVFLGAITITGATNSAGAITSEMEKGKSMVKSERLMIIGTINQVNRLNIMGEIRFCDEVLSFFPSFYLLSESFRSLKNNACRRKSNDYPWLTDDRGGEERGEMGRDMRVGKMTYLIASLKK